MLIISWLPTSLFRLCMDIPLRQIVLPQVPSSDSPRTDFAGGTNFVVLAILTLSMGISGNVHARNIVASLFVIIWGIRLSGFLLFRILKTGKDHRFDDKRDNFFKLLGFWVFQMIWVWTVSLPVTILNSPNVSYPPNGGGTSKFNAPTDIIGIVFFAIGFMCETVADVEKVSFSSNKANNCTNSVQTTKIQSY